nr:restriction endonuclease subunit S [Methanosarcina sp. KYL-1]
MFGDPVANPKGWQCVLLGKYTTKIGSGATPTGGESAYKKSGISLIRSLNVRDGEFTYKDLAFIDEQQARKLANVQVEENDVLLNITGASVARVCRVPKTILPARVNQHVSIIRPNSNLNFIFLEQLLLSPSMKRKLLRISGAGATREAITKAQLEEFEVILPPLILQKEFAHRIATMEKLKAVHKASLAELDELFASLQHRAFRGEL